MANQPANFRNKFSAPPALLLCLAVLLAGTIWWASRFRQLKELSTLYSFASGGDLESVKRLSEYHSPHAAHWLNKLAQDRNAAAYSRVEAINALAKKHSIDSKTLASLLGTEQPFVVRRATAEVLEPHGCYDDCVSAALHALNELERGHPTLEMQLYAQHPSTGSSGRETASRLSSQSRQDYFKLLNSNPCLARKMLKSEYSTDSSFIESVITKLGPC